MSSSMSALSALMPVSLPARTFFVRCSPMPKTFTDRRAVLKTLQNITQNDVEVFRKLKDNSSFIVVTTKIESTQKALHDSPYQRTILGQGLDDPSNKPTRATWGALYNVHSSITTPINPIPADRTGSGLAPPPGSMDASPADTVAQKTFTIHCFPANKDFDHDKMIRQDPLHGPWPDNSGIETYTSASLRQAIPGGHMAAGLRDWESGRQMLRDSSSVVDEDAAGASTVLLGKTTSPSVKRSHILERVRKRNHQDARPEIMDGLVAFAKKVQSKKDTTTLESKDTAKGGELAAMGTIEDDSKDPTEAGETTTVYARKHGHTSPTEDQGTAITYASKHCRPGFAEQDENMITDDNEQPAGAEGTDTDTGR